MQNKVFICNSIHLLHSSVHNFRLSYQFRTINPLFRALRAKMCRLLVRNQIHRGGSDDHVLKTASTVLEII